MLPLDSPINKGAMLLWPYLDGLVPYVYTSPEDELLACRNGAWLGIFLTLSSPVYDLEGPDIAELMNRVSVNRDYNKLKVGGSRHTILCNEKGQMLADGVLMRVEENRYRTYWLAPTLAYYAEVMAPEWGLDVKGTPVTDEFFIQIDGPRSLEIMEKAAKCDLHDLKFAQHKHIEIDGVPCSIHRLGMSGCLAYEMHGSMSEFGHVYDCIYNAGIDMGIRKLGIAQYCRNHTQGGYPNQWIHYCYPTRTSGEGLSDFVEAFPYMYPGQKVYNYFGSAAGDVENAFVTPFDVKWDYLINWDHDFIGKEALAEIAKNPPRTVVTLEWDAEDVGRAYAEKIANAAVHPADDITSTGDGAEMPFVISLVKKDGEQVGIASGRTKDFYHRKMLSLAFVRRDLAQEGTELEVVWGTNPEAQTCIKATVAAFPYYNEEYRNETFDVEKIPHPEF